MRKAAAGAGFVVGHDVELVAGSGVHREGDARIEHRRPVRSEGERLVVGRRRVAGRRPERGGDVRDRHRVRRHDASRFPDQQGSGRVGDDRVARPDAHPLRRRLVPHLVERGPHLPLHRDRHGAIVRRARADGNRRVSGSRPYPRTPQRRGGDDASGLVDLESLGGAQAFPGLPAGQRVQRLDRLGPPARTHGRQLGREQLGEVVAQDRVGACELGRDGKRPRGQADRHPPDGGDRLVQPGALGDQCGHPGLDRPRRVGRLEQVGHPLELRGDRRGVEGVDVLEEPEDRPHRHRRAIRHLLGRRGGARRPGPGRGGPRRRPGGCAPRGGCGRPSEGRQAPPFR